MHTVYPFVGLNHSLIYPISFVKFLISIFSDTASSPFSLFTPISSLVLFRVIFYILSANPWQPLMCFYFIDLFRLSLLLLLLLLSRFSHVWLCATPLMEAHEAPPSLGFSRQEHWSGLPLPSRLTLLQSLIIYRTILLINCFKSSHHFRSKLSHMLGNTRNNNLVNKQNTNGIVNNISGIKSKYFSHEPPTPIFFFFQRLSRLGNGSRRADFSCGSNVLH